ncbi:chromate transporter [Thermanaerosceptrum fracticalcis]|nr:chromate transporter [Thermanaerosceptrum fracticalcis]
MLWELFLTFTFIGAFSFGGGYGMLPLIQQEVVYNHQWLTIQQFTDILAVAEMTPGPVAVNTATYVGYKMAGVLGSALATTGVVLPSFVLITTLASIVIKNKDNPRFQGAFQGLRPVVVALVIGAAILVGKDTIVNITSVILALIALGLMEYTKLHPIFILLAFGVLGIIIY